MSTESLKLKNVCSSTDGWMYGGREERRGGPKRGKSIRLIDEDILLHHVKGKVATRTCLQHVHVHAHVHAHSRTRRRTRARRRAHMHTHVPLRAHTYIHGRTQAHTHVRRRAHMRTHARTHTHPYAHTHTYTGARRKHDESLLHKNKLIAVQVSRYIKHIQGTSILSDRTSRGIRTPVAAMQGKHTNHNNKAPGLLLNYYYIVFPPLIALL